jgi:dihydroorotate dehydrogenase
VNLALIARIYHKLSPGFRYLPLTHQISLASWGRRWFMHRWLQHQPTVDYTPDKRWEQTLWGIKFRSPLSNAAGMFKNGEGYDFMAQIGAGAFIGGTSTANPRGGNWKNGIYLPFINLPQSKVALNFLGLPNLGDAVLAAQTITRQKVLGCPIGWSVMRSPDLTATQGMEQLINSLWLYHNQEQIDFIEINESCPNLQLSTAAINQRLRLITQKFLSKRQRHLPVIVKLSTDISGQSLINLVRLAVQLGFDGLNLGNTSTAYADYRPQITAAEQPLFDFFSANFGGGISGTLLKTRSLELCAIAAQELTQLKPQHEFNLIRSGGVEQLQDIKRAHKHGVALCQWYSGFFNAYAREGDLIYNNLFRHRNLDANILC